MWCSAWRRKWQPSLVFLPGEYHGQRNLEGYSPGGHEESDTKERLSTHLGLWLLEILEGCLSTEAWLRSSLPMTSYKSCWATFFCRWGGSTGWVSDQNFSALPTGRQRCIGWVHNLITSPYGTHWKWVSWEAGHCCLVWTFHYPLPF